MLCYAKLCYVKLLCYVMLCYVMLSYVMLSCYNLLCFVVWYGQRAHLRQFFGLLEKDETLMKVCSLAILHCTMPKRSGHNQLALHQEDGSTSYLGMGQVQNGRLYIWYRSSSRKNEAEECRKLTDYIHLLL